MERESPKNDPLRQLMREWKVTESLPPRFQENVWRRIEAAREPESVRIPAWLIFVRWIETMLPHPALATAYVIVLLAIGAAAGWTQADHKTARVKDELGQRYVQVVVPHAGPRQ